MHRKKYYDALNLEYTEDKDAIKKAYFELVKIYHPDKPTGNADKFREIKEAYDYLMKASLKNENATDGNPYSFSKFRKKPTHQNITINLNVNIETFLNNRTLEVKVPYQEDGEQKNTYINLNLSKDRLVYKFEKYPSVTRLSITINIKLQPVESPDYCIIDTPEKTTMLIYKNVFEDSNYWATPLQGVSVYKNKNLVYNYPKRGVQGKDLEVSVLYEQRDMLGFFDSSTGYIVGGIIIGLVLLLDFLT